MLYRSAWSGRPFASGEVRACWRRSQRPYLRLLLRSAAPSFTVRDTQYLDFAMMLTVAYHHSLAPGCVTRRALPPTRGRERAVRSRQGVWRGPDDARSSTSAAPLRRVPRRSYCAGPIRGTGAPGRAVGRLPASPDLGVAQWLRSHEPAGLGPTRCGQPSPVSALRAPMRHPGSAGLPGKPRLIALPDSTPARDLAAQMRSPSSACTTWSRAGCARRDGVERMRNALLSTLSHTCGRR